MKQLYTKMYEEYCKTGFAGVQFKFGYKHTIVNFIIQCKRYVDEYIPRSGKKRGHKTILTGEMR